MDDNIVLVKLWGQRVGYLHWDRTHSAGIFEYEPAFVAGHLDIAPLTMPINSERSRRGLPWIGEKGKIYQGLPPMMADSLPDKWGDSVFNAWIHRQRIPISKITPVDRLLYIGTRGMGALEYEPAHVIGKANFPVDVNELYLFAQSILSERQETSIKQDKNILWQDLVKIGTSAGGKRPKALVAINAATGEIRSGQTDVGDGFEHYILKFDEANGYPSAKIEYVYSKMAKDAGIFMMPSKILEHNGIAHFVTRRFDREHNRKIHTQTFAALEPSINSYEDAFRLLRRLNLPYGDTEQLYRQMVFNVLGRNVDDHTKNFSLRMFPDGRWQLSPAYDLTFSVDLSAPEYVNCQSLSIGGKTSRISKLELEEVGRQQDISNVGEIIEQISEALHSFPRHAQEIELPNKYAECIQSALIPEKGKHIEATHLKTRKL